MKQLSKLFIYLLLIIGVIWLYTSSLIGVNESSKKYLSALKKELKAKDLSPSFFVISGRRWSLDNYLLNRFGGAAKKSQHLQGNAIDIIVLDVNSDGNINAKDVTIVYNILDKKIINKKGGIGTYKNEKGFFNRQMIHFDCRGKKARWYR